ncbi:MAG: hypothetical protein COX90_02475 [Candidatus Nealsonbacteria bacterium CG_4_10_14_0_2_um_filter_38_17]|uniref:TIGR00725 family protein n=2 Tax=Candidatus Nealsoniibacteriota TaxID=1817911 RepID=A0A2M7UY91_9BACT|nr:MAG: hypothetical protein COX36_01700 [Candidatus Nealsonbacteria bacterium CG23_combo_of_CG06-09_8_20_14_all_38_19]PIZ88845.1 MAG: hypothetical protein COX90_02475 [Candidatus Nealsonbacteria bacterium CG_4_10_14_0_2_um_filter_38_17]
MTYKIAVSGAAQVGHCAKGVIEMAKEVGRELARRNCVLVTGATTGIPYHAAQGVKEAGGISIGFSPAISELAHVKTYRLPLDYFDLIVYTGFDYSGRNLLMTRAADAIIIICGRMGTLNEFTIAFEDQKPIGVLEGSGGTADRIRSFIIWPYRGKRKIIYEKDPRKLVNRLLELIKKDKKFNAKT